MKNKIKVFNFIAIVLIFTLSATSCSGQSGGGKSLNSAEELKKYLDSQPANSPDKPIKVSMTINDPMLKNVVDVIKSAGKYVSLNITGNALTTIPSRAFINCETLVGITIPNSVTRINLGAFYDCNNLTSVTFQGTISSDNLMIIIGGGEMLSPFDGDLRAKYLVGDIGTYTTTAPVDSKNSKWTKK